MAPPTGRSAGRFAITTPRGRFDSDSTWLGPPWATAASPAIALMGHLDTSGTHSTRGSTDRADRAAPDEPVMDARNSTEAARPASRGGYEVLLLGTFGDGGIHQYVESQRERLADHVRVSTYDMYTDWGGSGPRWFTRSFLRSLLAAARFPFRRPPDVVHVHASQAYSFVRAAFYVLFAAHVWRRPVVLHIHGSSFHEFLDTDSRLLSALQARVFAASDRVIVLSTYWKEVLSTHVPEDRIHVLPNAVETAEFDPQYRPTVPHVVFVSSLIDRKGVTELVEAVDTLADETDTEFRVSIGGKGPHAPAVQALADRHPEVEYLGYVSETAKRDLLSRASIYVLPTYAEGLPIAMLEGMAGGNAVVSTPVAAIPEVIGADNGILVEPGDARELATALRTLIEDPERTESMARANRQKIEATYAWDVVVDDLLRIYAAVLADDGSRS